MSVIDDGELPKDLLDFYSVENPLLILGDHIFNSSRNSLRKVNIEFSDISIIPKALTDLNNLKILEIHYSKVRHLDHLFAIKGLETLILSFNEICRFTDSPHRESLVRLDLNGNCLTEIPHLEPMRSLKVLDVSNNNISQHESGSLPQSLTTLDVGDNRLSSVPTAVYGLSQLESLSLVKNKIRTIDSLPGMFPSSLKHLYLSDNEIAKVSSILFTNATSRLETLYLDGNPLTTIEPGAFKHMATLDWLELSATHLTRLPMGKILLSSVSTFMSVFSRVCSCPILWKPPILLPNNI